MSRKFEITNTNAEPRDIYLLDHSYSSNTSIIDSVIRSVSPTFDLQNNNQMESENNLKKESKSSSIPFTYLVSKSKEQLSACHLESNKTTAP